ncbi:MULTISPECIES: DUF1003 domain-containing protein [Ramlibacter]|uniref:DUF1003 domain-containing protein n=1 Tax=Ramlibacter pinisoli TaxID=2682844 RepID=A0A6N8IQU2_9BURK|nr:MULTISPECIES: DUF1003 domain-containing protein [Ramlibacter]MBA2964313.1 DUF1003 domain-containing protein [Ramlibacter sp. CGMCC 1.13660]MVQ29279.1 DUF1003 domain-containing protein [Ramlibacter pinisoli]
MSASARAAHAHPSVSPRVRDLVRRNISRMRQMEEWSKRDRSFADRAADAVARFCGQMGFVWIHAVLFAAWLGWNTLPHLPHFDPYPFTFLTLCVSLEAIFLSAFILISQNYEMRLTERRTQLDLQINLLAEQENTKMLALLQQIARKMGVLDEDDPEVAALSEAVRPEMIGRLIEEAYAEDPAHAHPHPGTQPPSVQPPSGRAG